MAGYLSKDLGPIRSSTRPTCPTPRQKLTEIRTSSQADGTSSFIISPQTIGIWHWTDRSGLVPHTNKTLRWASSVVRNQTGQTRCKRRLMLQSREPDLLYARAWQLRHRLQSVPAGNPIGLFSPFGMKCWLSEL